MTKPESGLPGASYMAELSAIVQATEVTDIANEGVSFEHGLARMLDMVRVCKDQGGKVMFIGNGGSATIASHMAIDYNNMSCAPAMALNDSGMLTCLGNDFGYEHVFDKQLGFVGRAEDLLIAISSSGKSQNILNAVSAARAKDMAVITMSGFGGDNPLRGTGDLNFYINSSRYGYVEIAHLILCHAVADMSGDWQPGA